MSIITVSSKFVISGKFVESYNYGNPYKVGKPRPRYKPQNAPVLNRKLKTGIIRTSRADNVLRTKKALKRMVNSNPDLNKFLTLTFAENQKDWKIANGEFRKFIKRCSRKYKNFKYIAVPEFQKRGAIHFHLVCNINYLSIQQLDGLRILWRNGWIDLKRIDKLENVGAYMAKYMTKQNCDSRFFHKKKFFRSLRLMLPQIIQGFKNVLNYKAFLDFWKIKTLLFEATIDSYYLGSIQYKLFRL